MCVQIYVQILCASFVCRFCVLLNFNVKGMVH